MSADTSLGCAQCGHCCEVIHLTAGAQARLEQKIEAWDRFINLDDATMTHLACTDWDMPNWRSIRDLMYRDWYGVLFQFEFQFQVNSHYGPKDLFVCKAFDSKKRVCTIHDYSPNICQGFPFYGKTNPEYVGVCPGTQLDQKPYDCSYWLDVNGWSKQNVRPLLPVEVIRHGE